MRKKHEIVVILIFARRLIVLVRRAFFRARRRTRPRPRQFAGYPHHELLLFEDEHEDEYDHE